MVTQDQIKNKRTFYKILQVSDDADAEAIDAAYQRIKSKYEDANDAAARNELLFVEQAYKTLSDPNSRKLYDRQIANNFAPTTIQSDYYVQTNDSWFSSSKLLVVMIGVLAVIAYGLKTRHSEEVSKIGISKEMVVGNNEVSRIGADGVVQNTSKAIDVTAEIAQRQLDIQQQDAETRRMEAESRIRANEERVAAQKASLKAAAEREDRCRYMHSLITQANNAGAYEEARALQARGCN
jgi:curved DNA-binding protein CbpA